MAKLRKSHSNYVLRRKRQLTTKGAIYERDWMTVSELDGFAPGTLPVYASGNFKMTINNDRGGKKKYSFSNWLLNDSGDTEWNLSMIQEEELRIKSELIKPNYNSILDFAYYGSAAGLVNGTVNDLIMRYPGELYVTGREYKYVNTDGTYVSISNYVENPFMIDLCTEHVKKQDVDNPYRYMCLSWDKYEVITGDSDSGTSVTSWTPGKQEEPCNNGDYAFRDAKVNNITFDGIYVNGKVIIKSSNANTHVRLQKKYIDEIFDSFDDFEKTLLNRETKPKYKATFYTPHETESGVVTYLKSYIWPVMEGGWNLDIESQTYASYLENLLYIAEYYDELRSDNLWRSYTHESIKNFDWTTPKSTYEPEIDGHLIDIYRMEAIMKIAGRQFDDLKRYIENIKFTVNVSYDSKNNMPEKNLAKFLEMNGWEVKNVAPVNDNTLERIDKYPGIIVKNTPESANAEFLKRMILNSRNILSKKGTRAGIEAVYSMFGIFDLRYGEKLNGKKIGYTIEEFDNFATKFISNEAPEGEDLSDYDKIVALNAEKTGFVEQYEKDLNDFAGLMVARIEYDGVEYLVPWYDVDEVYDGNPYYQMLGGWGKRERKNVLVNLGSDEWVETVLESDSGCTTGFTIYDETVKNVKVVEDFDKLNHTPIGFLEEGDFYYVLNTTNDTCSDDNASHYVFFTGTTDYGNVVRYNDDYCWCLVGMDELTGDTDTLEWYAKKILYLESVHDSSIGNNPHNGNGRYDRGSSYFEFYNEIFKTAVEDDLFAEYRDKVDAINARRHYENRFRNNKLDDVTAITETYSADTYGFEVKTCPDDFSKDNLKIWYFLSADSGIYDTAATLSKKEVAKNYFIYKRGDKTETTFSGVTKDDFTLDYTGSTDNYNRPIWNTGSTITIDNETLAIPSSITDIASGNTSDEVVSYSVVNNKNIRITYTLPWEMEDYVTNVVEFYVKQMIPSTAIVEFKWNYTDGKPEAKHTYSHLHLSPTSQRIRSGDTDAEIDIKSLNVDVENVSISMEDNK